MAKYKTEKRPAKVGERILITNAFDGEPCFQNGDIGVVRGFTEDVVAIVEINGRETGIIQREYEVIIENGGEEMGVGIIEKMQAEIEELKAKVAKLEGGEAVAKKATPKIRLKTVQEMRDGIAAKAKRDVAKLKNYKGKYEVADPDSPAPWWCNAEFIVNNEKRAVVVLLKGAGSGTIFAKGIAKCAPNDCFNSHIGKAIALRRALGLTVPNEYLNAPQPTEVRVGDIILRSGNYESTKGKRTVTAVESRTDGRKMYETLEGGGMTYEEYIVKIIDDSREEVTQWD